MPDYCPYAWLIPWTSEGQAYAKKMRENFEFARDMALRMAEEWKVALEATKEKT